MATIPETLAIAVAQHQNGGLHAAERLYREVLAVEPDNPDALHLLGVIAYQTGRTDIAAEHIRRAISLNGTDAGFHYNLGCVLLAQEKLGDAAECCRHALALKPDFADAHNLLASAFMEQGRFGEAVAAYRRALAIKPDYVMAQSNLAACLKNQGRLDDALAGFRRVLELKPDYASARDNLLHALHYRPGIGLAELAAAHREYDQLHAAPLRDSWPRHENSRQPARRLRVGLVSADFGRHPVGYFLVRGLENLDREQIETICYSDRAVKDDLTTRLQAAATTWRDTAGTSHEQLAGMVHADRVDVLFDLGGHTSGNRLPVFARKPAPVQVTWAGYVGTTGLAAMDYIFADRWEIPPESEKHYRERVLRMPDGYICYDPPDYAPSVSPLPALENGYVTFAAFHNPPKITPQAVEIWSRVLNRLPDARLVLKYRGMDDPSVADRYAELFAAPGVDRSRLEFLGFSPHRETLAEYARVDIALDTFPYNGGLTTCEALWMGVPVVTCPGETFAGRHGLSHLSNVGLTVTIAGNLEEYVEIAVGLANDLPRLVALRAGLRQRVAASPLCDGKRFAENFQDVIRGVWRDWCEKGS